ncbi:RING finger and transmembrane domain-containing protein [Quillaja saponaria]|uniref:RING finger and transmembrane domain-containing protein n=1 Tax=Quillaja saponaria TaxID=32244 RepID=A0AAD7LM10_QUISA|nr:RING finger and transmembrane domain-containing protein [Quillaja saponaria]
METSGTNSDHYANSSSTAGGINSSNSNSSTAIWQGMQFSAVNPLRSLLSFVLDYSGILRSGSVTHDSDAVRVDNSVSANEFRPQLHTQSTDSDAANGCSGSSSSTGEVSIQIIGAGAQDHNVGISSVSLPFQNQAGEVGYEENGLLMGNRGGYPALANGEDSHGGVIAGERDPLVPSSSSAGNGQVGEDSGVGSEGNSSNSSSYQRYDIQQVARWIEQILPFSLLLLVVFIRQHLQGFFGTIWISAIMYKSNDIVRKQTALKGDRNVSVIASYSVAFMLHIMCIYWWYQNDDLLYPLVMLPPKEIPPFWHAIFIILVNDTMVRQAAMAFKCLLLIYYKNGRGHNFRRQGQMLTLVEYTLLLYRALLPTPVWYRFFLDKDYGGLFSSLTTGLYLTFKLTSVVEKVQCFFSAIKALSRKEVHYGVYATLEQVNTAGDLCAICQEKMHSPILLRCKHVFCEECVSEWFERERTCPLCRALVKPADLRTFGDGSTSLFFQLF